MRAFQVKAKTLSLIVKDREEWAYGNVKDYKTTKDLLFFLEEIVIDPIGKVGTGPQNSNVIGGKYAEAGYYGFNRDGYTLLVHQSRVNVL